MLNAVGNVIREYREKQGLTIAQLAEKAGVSDSFVSRLERNSVGNARVAKLNDVAHALNVELSDLFTKSNLNDPNTIELMHYLSQLPKDQRSDISATILKLLKL